MSLREPLAGVLPIYDPAASAVPPEVALEAFADGGASWVEYRNKGASDREFYGGARRALAKARQLGILLLVNDRVEVALALGTGVHLGQDDLPAAVARELLGPDAVIGLSTDSLANVSEAAGLPVDYVAVGPVYATGSKGDAGAPVGLERVVAARALTDLPLVAIGGIDATNASAAIAAGADAVAVVSALLDVSDIAAATRRLREVVERSRAGRS